MGNRVKELMVDFLLSARFVQEVVTLPLQTLLAELDYGIRQSEFGATIVRIYTYIVKSLS